VIRFTAGKGTFPRVLLPVLACFALSLGISLPVTALLVRAGHRLGALDSPGSPGHAKTLRKVPNIGGIAIVAGAVGPLLVASLAVLAAPDLVIRLVPAAEPFLPRFHDSAITGLAIAGGAIVLHLVGLVDDRRALGALAKFLPQLAVALGIAWIADVRLFSFLEDFGPFGAAASVALTVLWIVAIVNALNFTDNMDGLAGGLATIAALVMIAATVLGKQWFVASAFAMVAGATLGFLAFNRPPARIFMGDGGSLPLGFLLATLVARTTFVDIEKPDYALGTAWYGTLMPLLVLAIPIYDLVAVTAVRLAQGRSPLVGGEEHFSHRLVRLGLSRPEAVGVILMLAAVLGISGIFLGSLAPWQAVLVGVQAVLVLTTIATLEFAVHGRKRDGGAPK
jgi:UDP-GlcNAc:undecaprenyl-phosphate GlcNAc-1-phosphate transferase